MPSWRFSLGVLVLALASAGGDAVASGETIRGDEACEVRELSFFNGFALSLPPGLCAARTRGPDYWIYQIAFGEKEPPFLEAYVGNGANFPYFAPPEGVEIRESLNSETLPCGALFVRETPRGGVTQVGGAVTRDGKRCGEILVRATAVDGTISSPAIHFSYSGITTEQEQVVFKIIDSVRRAEELPDDPPLKSGGA